MSPTISPGEYPARAGEGYLCPVPQRRQHVAHCSGRPGARLGGLLDALEQTQNVAARLRGLPDWVGCSRASSSRVLGLLEVVE